MDTKKRLEFLQRLYEECEESPALYKQLRDFYKEYESADFTKLLELEEKFQMVIATYLHYCNKLFDKKELLTRLQQIFA